MSRAVASASAGEGDAPAASAPPWRRLLRSLEASGELRREVRGGWCWWVRASDEQVVSPWLDGAAASFEAGRPDVEVLKHDKGADVARLGDDDAHGVSLLLKRYNLHKKLTPVWDVLRGTRARRGFALGYGLERTRIRTARVLAFGEQRVGPMSLRSCLITRFVTPGRTLMHLLDDAQSAGDHPLLDAAVDATAGVVARLHNHGYAHRDLKADNFIISEMDVSDAGDGAALCATLVDLDGLRGRRWLTRRRRAKDLRRLHRSFHQHPAVYDDAWPRFRAAYERKAGAC